MNPTFREQKRIARTTLHAIMAEPVWYIPFKQAQLVPATIRLHLNFTDLGEIRRAGFAESMEITPKAIFLNSELIPSKLAIVVTDTQGAFQVDRIYPPDDITTKVDITVLPIGQYAQWGLNKSLPWCGLPDPLVASGAELFANINARTINSATLT